MVLHMHPAPSAHTRMSPLHKHAALPFRIFKNLFSPGKGALARVVDSSLACFGRFVVHDAATYLRI